MSTTMYLIKEGYSNLKKHGSKTFSTMLIICATMLILGIFILLFKNVNSNVETMVSQQGLQAFIDDSASDDDIEYLKDQIELINGVKNVEYIDRESAFEDAKETFSDMEYLLEGLENVNFLPASFVVTFDDISLSSTIKNEIEKLDNVSSVKYKESTINAVISISHIANVFLLGVGGVMFVVSIFIISNTIKLAVYSNKREIFIMRYIGATNKFIKLPFIVEGAIIGLMSACITFIVISLAYVGLYARLPQVGSSIGVFGFVPYSTMWYQVLAVYLIIGLVIGILGSSISIRKYLKV